MKQQLEAIGNSLQNGVPAALLTVIERAGSAPRGAGAAMTLSADGVQTGTIGGGSLEYRAGNDALAMLERKTGGVRTYSIYSDESASAVGEPSGSVRVLIRVFYGETGLTAVLRAQQAIARGENAYWATEIQNEQAESPMLLGEASLLAGNNGIPRLKRAPSRPVLTESEPAWWIEPLRDAPRVVIFGGGHVAQKTAALLAFLGYRVWVVEDRAEFSKRELFPAAERVLQSDYGAAERLVSITRRDHAVVLARGHETDVKILRWLLKSEADYIGCIGSAKKIALTRETLLAEGLSVRELARLHSPVGLKIGAETPEEIAISIAAELIAHCSGTKLSL